MLSRRWPGVWASATGATLGWLQAPFPPQVFQVFVVAFCAKVAIFSLIGRDLSLPWSLGVVVAWCLVAFGASRRLGVCLLLIERLDALVSTWPYTINHTFFETWVLLFVAVLGARGTAQQVAVPARSILALTLSVWLYAGIQKLVHGHYLSGEVLALHGLSPRGSMHTLFAGLGLDPLAVDTDGHVQIDLITRWAVLLASWSVVLLEGLLPLLAFWRKTRRAAWMGLMGLLCMIALPAEEYSFFCSASLCVALGLVECFWPRVHSGLPSLPGPVPWPGTRLASQVAAAMLCLLCAWPPVHMALTVDGAVSSWRLGGWGMYATPHPHAHARVHVVPVGEPLAGGFGLHPRLSLAAAERPFTPIEQGSSSTGPRVAAACQALRQFSDPAAAAFLLRRGQTRGADGDVFVLRPRVDLRSLRAHYDVMQLQLRSGRVQTRRLRMPLAALAGS